jgi:3-(3-hydroxy-phenyl)propionate hydroxylase
LELARDLFFRMVRHMPSLRDYVLQMKFKPMPRYAEGVVLPGTDTAAQDVVGRMFMQPLVETAEGRQVKLDETLGPWFAVIGIGADPTAALSAASRAFWRDLGARIVLVRPSRAGVMAGGAVGDVTPIEDLMGAFRDWRRARPAIRYIILRPDRYVAAVAGDDDLNDVTDRFRTLLQM